MSDRLLTKQLCTPPCPLHICAEMSKQGMCSLHPEGVLTSNEVARLLRQADLTRPEAVMELRRQGASEIDRLRAALEWFADPRNYEDTIEHIPHLRGNPVWSTGINRARQALSGDSSDPETKKERAPDFAALSQVMGNPCLEPADDESFEAALVREAVRRLSESSYPKTSMPESGKPFPFEDISFDLRAPPEETSARCTCGTKTALHEFGCGFRRDGDDGKGAVKASVPRCPWCGGQHIGTDCKAEKANAEVRTDAGVSPASHAEEVPLAEGSVLTQEVPHD